MVEATYRAIVPIEGIVVDRRDAGPVPEQRWIDIASLVVDETYQRPIGPSGRATVKGIVAHFDWRRFAPVVVCPIEGGLYAIIDGQHRVTAAATRGIGKVPCHVVQADRPTQATAFAAINGHVTRMTGLALFKARLAAGDETALRVEAAATAAGVRVLTFTRNWAARKPRETDAIRALEATLRDHGDGILTIALSAVAWSAGNELGLINALSIAAFGEVLADHAEWRDHARLQSACELFHLAETIEAVKVDSLRLRVDRKSLLEAALITHLTRELDSDAPRRMAQPQIGARAHG